MEFLYFERTIKANQSRKKQRKVDYRDLVLLKKPKILVNLHKNH